MGVRSTSFRSLTCFGGVGDRFSSTFSSEGLPFSSEGLPFSAGLPSRRSRLPMRQMRYSWIKAGVVPVGTSW